MVHLLSLFKTNSNGDARRRGSSGRSNSSSGRKRGLPSMSGDMKRSISSSSLASAGEMRRRISMEGLGPGGSNPNGGGGDNDFDPDTAKNLQYVETVMYGRYTDLAEFALATGKKTREKSSKDSDDYQLSKELEPAKGKVPKFIVSCIRPIWANTFAKCGEQWIFLFILGLVMASLSYSIDAMISLLFRGITECYILLIKYHWAAALLVWVALPCALVCFAVLFTSCVAPSAAGSGIPEMKTILRGCVLKEYLTPRTLLAKIVGLTAVIGAGLPLGKEGPVMHMASILATQLSKFLHFIKGTDENEQKSTDLLAAACTMGVAVCYGAPIGGVLFSIEVTTTYFAVRNYWRGFFAAGVGATFYLLLKCWFSGADTIYPLFNLRHIEIKPYDIIELLPFICISICQGLLGAGFVFLHRRYVLFMRKNKLFKSITTKNKVIYPILVTVLITVMTFPKSLGQYMCVALTPTDQIKHLFSNITWGSYDGSLPSPEQADILQYWTKDGTPNFLISLLLFQVVNLMHICLASTLPVATGLLIPLMKVGAAFGRMVGELMVMMYPAGIVAGTMINPGTYAMVGAAGFCAAITHTMSISVIIFELTGNISYVIPIIIGVFISNCISASIQPSIYDSVIRIKRLPYLPDIISSTSDVYNTFVEDIMVKEVIYIWYGMKYSDLYEIIKNKKRVKFYPLVDSHDNMILLGSVKRANLVRSLFYQLNDEKRRKEAQRRRLEALRDRFQNDALTIQQRISCQDDLKNAELEALQNDENDDADFDNSMTHYSTHSTARLASAAANLRDVRDIFGNRDALERRSSRFSVSKVNNRNGGSVSLDIDSSTSSSSGSNKRNNQLGNWPNQLPIKIKKNIFKKKKTSRGKMTDDKEEDKKIDEKKIFFQARKESTVKRSNSLDSLNKVKTDIKPDSVAKEGEDETDKTDGSDSPADSSISNSPVKGILKRRNSISLGVVASPVRMANRESHYQTITSGDNRLKTVILDRMRRTMDTATSMDLKLSQISLFRNKKKEYALQKQVIDLYDAERQEWENEQLSLAVDFDQLIIDPAPFQLVERTSLLRVHSLFSLVGINHSYVTNIGRLKGVVALKELRKAIEGTTNPPDKITPKKMATISETTASSTPSSLNKSLMNNNHPIKRSPQSSHIEISMKDAPPSEPSMDILNRKVNLQFFDNGRMV